MSNLPENRPPETPPGAHTPMEMVALQRRRALLSGLGKGSAAIAALVPLASQGSSRERVLHNPALGGNGYCSVSGFQSAAISSTPGAVACASTPPSDFFVPTDGSYLDKTGGDAATAKRRGIKAALKEFPFSIPDTVNITNTQLDALKVAGGKSRIAGKVYVARVVTLTGGSLKELKASTNFPTWVSAITPLTAFNSGGFMGAGSGNTILEELALNSNNAYFAAAFLTCVNEDHAVTSNAGFDAGVLPFDAAYVRDQYKNNQVDAAVFFKALAGL